MAHSPPTFNSSMPSAKPRFVAGAFIAAYPDVDQEAVLTALGKFPRSGNMAADLAKAHEMAGQRPSRPGKRQRSMRSEMEETYRRVNRR